MSVSAETKAATSFAASLDAERAPDQLAVEGVGRARHLDNIESRRQASEQRLRRKQRAGSADYPIAFACGDARCAAAVLIARAVTHFDDRKRRAVHRDDVEFAAAGAEIVLQDPVADALQVAGGGRFCGAADLEMRREAQGAGTVAPVGGGDPGGGISPGGGNGTGRPSTTCAQSSSRWTRP